MGDSFPYDRAFGALIVRFLSIPKILTEEKSDIVETPTWIFESTVTCTTTTAR